MPQDFNIDSVIDVDDPSNNDRLFPADFGRGLVVPSSEIVQMMAPPSDIPLIPRNEWDARLEEQAAQKSSCLDYGHYIEVLNQERSNFCWAHSSVAGCMFIRAKQNQPYVPLSAYSVAATLTKGANDGGWCGWSAKFLREVGCCSQAVWRQGDFNYRQYEGNPDFARYKINLDYADLTRSIYDQNLTFDQVATCLLMGIPCAVDFNWWSHSVLAVRLVRVEAGSYGLEIRNSWGTGWENGGNGILRGQKAIPNGAIAFRAAIAA
jgi:hypothetical protein